jgi:hypothetical protein
MNKDNEITSWRRSKQNLRRMGHDATKSAKLYRCIRASWCGPNCYNKSMVQGVQRDARRYQKIERRTTIAFSIIGTRMLQIRSPRNIMRQQSGGSSLHSLVSHKTNAGFPPRTSQPDFDFSELSSEMSLDCHCMLNWEHPILQGLSSPHVPQKLGS